MMHGLWRDTRPGQLDQTKGNCLVQSFAGRRLRGAPGGQIYEA